MSEYLFTSARLGFRQWQEKDIAPFSLLCADPNVMEFFPNILTQEETIQLISQFNKHLEIHQTTFFAVDLLENKEFIGFIGMIYKKDKCEFAEPPAIEIGWRLKHSSWGNGYATEGARRCLEYCKDTLNETIVHSITPIPNVKSEQVMRKIGMKKIGEYNYSKIAKGHWLERHVIYKIHL